MNVITIEKNAEAFYKLNVSTITRHFALAKNVHDAAHIKQQ